MRSGVVKLGKGVIGIYEIARSLRRLHMARAGDPVPEELRGWSSYMPPVRPRAYLGLGVGEVAYRYCETRRDLYLRRVRGLRVEPSRQMLDGQHIHRIVWESMWRAASAALSGKSPWDAYEEILMNASEIARSICGENSFGECGRTLKALSPAALGEMARF